MVWLLGLLLVGTVVYGIHHPQPTEPGKPPTFDALIYTLDLLLPIIDFGQEQAFSPGGAYQGSPISSSPQAGSSPPRSSRASPAQSAVSDLGRHRPGLC